MLTYGGLPLKTGKVLIVDGYNVIHRVSKFAEAEDAAVLKLAEFLNSARFVDFDKIYLVVDAKELSRLKQKAGRAEVVFTREGETADNVALEIGEELAREHTVYIVSDDFAVQLGALSRGCLRMTVREFMEVEPLGIEQQKKEDASTVESLISDEEREQLNRLYRQLLNKESGFEK